MASEDSISVDQQLENYCRNPTEDNIQAITTEAVKNILLAAWMGDLATLQALLSVAMRDEKATTIDLAIHAMACIACQQGWQPILRYLLDTKKDAVFTKVNNGHGWIGIIVSKIPRPAIWATLLDYNYMGYKDNPSTLFGEFVGIVHGQHQQTGVATLKLFVAHGYVVDDSLVGRIAQFGDSDTLRYILSFQLPCTEETSCYNSWLLHDTVMRRRFDNVPLLIEAGFDVNEVPASGPRVGVFDVLEPAEPPLAVALSSLDMIRLLMGYGARPDVMDGNGRTVFQLAEAQKRFDALKLMWELSSKEGSEE